MLDPRHQALTEAIAQGDIVFVLGTGTSVQGTGNADAASWTGLLRVGLAHAEIWAKPKPSAAWMAEQRERLESPTLDNLLAVATALETALQAPEGTDFKAFIEATVGRLAATNPALPQAIARLPGPRRALATTNYDTLLEAATGLPSVVWTDPDKVEAAARGTHPAIIHLHGLWNEEKSIILGQASYERLRASPHIQTLQKAMTLLKTLVFIGCGEDGLSDPNLGRLLEWLSLETTPGTSRHYLLCRNSQEERFREAFAAHPRIAIVPYGPDYADLPLFLESLIPKTADPPPGTLSNISIPVPPHFLGREAALTAIHEALQHSTRPVAITALHGMRGVGKTVLAAAYAQRHADTYSATWWLPAEMPDTLRPALAALGNRLGWTPSDMKDNDALPITLARLQRDGDGILLIYDNAPDAAAIATYLPTGGAARILVTSNNPAWRTLAEPVEIDTWPSAIGADYLIARTGYTAERDAAETLSETLGGLPLAHEMAAAFCEETGITLAAYAARFAATPLPLLDDTARAPGAYHDGLTVARAFTLAIEQATARHPAAGPLLAHAALLAPEPIPVFLFEEGREHLGEPLATDLAGLGLEDTIAALRAFALVTREEVPDEREPALRTDSLRLHRLVRQVAAISLSAESAATARHSLLKGFAAVYPRGVYDIPAVWPRARRLDAPALALLAETDTSSSHAAYVAATLLNGLAAYRQVAQADYAAARPLFERALANREQALGSDHPDTAASLNNLALLLRAQGDLLTARPLLERALTIVEQALGSDHLDTASSLNNLAGLLRVLDGATAARPLYERALAIREHSLGPDHPDTATCLNNLAALLHHQRDLTAARRLYERALEIRENSLGQDHLYTALSLNNLAFLLQDQGDLQAARPLYERALAIREKALGPSHPVTATALNNLAALLVRQGNLLAANPLFERALAICEQTIGSDHSTTLSIVRNTAALYTILNRPAEAAALRQRYNLPSPPL